MQWTSLSFLFIYLFLFFFKLKGTGPLPPLYTSRAWRRAIMAKCMLDKDMTEDLVPGFQIMASTCKASHYATYNASQIYPKKKNSNFHL